MARPNWEYIRVDVLLRYHPKLDGLTYPAKWTLIELWSHCGQFLTDGFVREQVWKQTGTASARRLLVERGLAQKVRGGYQMHDYLEHQRSRAEVEALRAKRSAAGKASAKARANAAALVEHPVEHPVEQNGSKPPTEAEAEAEADKPAPSFSYFTRPLDLVLLMIKKALRLYHGKRERQIEHDRTAAAQRRIR